MYIHISSFSMSIPRYRLVIGCVSFEMWKKIAKFLPDIFCSAVVVVAVRSKNVANETETHAPFFGQLHQYTDACRVCPFMQVQTVSVLIMLLMHIFSSTKTANCDQCVSAKNMHVGKGRLEKNANRIACVSEKGRKKIGIIHTMRRIMAENPKHWVRNDPTYTIESERAVGQQFREKARRKNTHT